MRDFSARLHCGGRCVILVDMKLLLQQYRGMRVCVALSGGIDSVCLLHYCLRHAAEAQLSVTAVTCEHGLRGEASLRDLAFVQHLCEQRKVPLRIFRADVAAMAAQQGTGTEEAGRAWRYACFAQVLDEGFADVVFTAHQRDDYAETVLFRLARGTAAAGLNAFPARSGLARPMLGVTRAEIASYARENGLAYVEDETNADERFARNRLRVSVLPVLEAAVPGAAEHLVQFAERISEDEAFLASLAVAQVRTGPDGARVSLSLPEPLFSRACLFAMKAYGIARDYTAVHVAQLKALRGLQSGRRVTLPLGVEAMREYGDVVFYRPRGRCADEFPFAVGEFAGEGFALSVTETAREGALCADFGAFPAGCVVRTRREGDVFTPFGGRRKPLKKFFTDRKIPARLGNLLPLVAKGSEVYAVGGAEIADDVKVTRHTVRRVYLYTAARIPDRAAAKEETDASRL